MANEKQQRYWSSFPMDYGPVHLDRGQVLEKLLGLPNDEKLTRLGYLREVDAKVDLFRCAECGAEFTSVGARTGHGDLRHKRHAFDSPDQEDQRVEREYNLAAQTTPLNLDRTVAGRR